MPRSDQKQPQNVDPPQRAPIRPEDAEPNVTPPDEARTDWDRGVGEMGMEELDPDRPLNEPAQKRREE